MWIEDGGPGSIYGVKGRWHQPDEVKFVEWIIETDPSWTKVDLMSITVFRHGFTILPRKRGLAKGRRRQ
jgi:hypothetical protein